MTLMEAVRAYIIADGTLAAKVANSTYPVVLPESPADNCAVIKIVSGVSWTTLLGATDQSNVRIEVTFWSKLFTDADVLCNRLRGIVSSFNGLMGGGSGVKVSVFQIMGPRTIQHPTTKYYGCQLDIMATVDLSTAT